MELFLLRHANADTIAATDDERPLSEKGVAQAMRVARFCEARGLAGMRVMSSPLPRAFQTAEIVAGHLGGEFLKVPWLACGMRPQVALDHLRECVDAKSVMLVGHEPDFSRLAAHLLGLSSGEQIEIRKASLTRLSLSSLEKGGARLDFLVPCRLM